MRQRLDQPLCLEMAKHLPHHRSADAELIAAMALDQALAGLEAQVEDRVTQLLQRELAQCLDVSVDRSGGSVGIKQC